MKITILGLGNILLGDEGFGVHFIRWFGKRWRLPEAVTLVDGGTLGYVLLDTVCSCDCLIVVDCIKLKDEPGSLYRFTREEIEMRMPPPTSAHEVEFTDLLCQADIMDEAPEVYFLCIVPEKYGDLELEMTETLKERFPDMERLLVETLSLCKVSLEPADHA